MRCTTCVYVGGWLLGDGRNLGLAMRCDAMRPPSAASAGCCHLLLTHPPPIFHHRSFGFGVVGGRVGKPPIYCVLGAPVLFTSPQTRRHAMTNTPCHAMLSSQSWAQRCPNPVHDQDKMQALDPAKPVRWGDSISFFPPPISMAFE
jgi:hypothetical protein